MYYSNSDDLQKCGIDISNGMYLIYNITLKCIIN